MASLRVLVACLGAVACAARGMDVAVEGLSLPFFNRAGVLTHKLVAARGSMQGNLRRLEDARILYFAADDPKRVVQSVAAANAVWNEAAGTLTGDGPITVKTETNTLSGDGFDFALGTSILHLHHHVRLANSDFVLTGDRATADLVIAKSGDTLQLRDVRRCEVSGRLHLVALHPEAGSLPFRQAFTDLAVYDGLARTITLPHPVRTLNASGIGTTKSAVIRLTPAPSGKSAGR